MGPYWKLQLAAYKVNDGVEIRIKSVNEDNSHSMGRNFSWLEKIGHELEQQGPRRQRAGNLRNAVRKLCVKLNVSDFASRSKAKAKPQRRDSASSSQELYLLVRELGLILSSKNIRSPNVQCRRN